MPARVVSPRHAVAAAAAALLFFTLLTVIRPAGHTVDFDLAIAHWISDHRSPAGIAVFTAVSFAGSVVGLVPIGLVIAAYLQRRGGWRPVRWLAITIAGATALYLAVNIPVERPRPPMGLRLYEDAAWSFPSGHSTQAVAFWIMTAVLVTADRSRRAQLVARAAAPVAIGLIGFSRIYLCAHWTTDVLGGFALGTFWVAAVLAMYERFDRAPSPR